MIASVITTSRSSPGGLIRKNRSFSSPLPCVSIQVCTGSRVARAWLLHRLGRISEAVPHLNAPSGNKRAAHSSKPDGINLRASFSSAPRPAAPPRGRGSEVLDRLPDDHQDFAGGNRRAYVGR
jgi:hypothetical protein